MASVAMTAAQTRNTKLRASVRKTAISGRKTFADGTLKAYGKITRTHRGVPTHRKGISSMTTRSKEVPRWLR